MAGGGSTQKTTSEPWKPAQPYLQDIFQQASQLSKQTPQYYPGQTTVGALPSEQQAWNQLFAANANTFGQGGAYENASGALTNTLTGNTPLAGMASALSGPATQGLISGIQQGPASVGRYGFDTTLNPYAMAPQFGQAGSLDATGALQSALSGQPDYSGAQANIDAANAGILRDFQNNILPSLNSRATFLNNGTGGIKALGNILPDLGARMNENATSILEAERQRALGAQQNAANLVAQGGLSSYGMGLTAAGQQAGLQQALAGQNLATDQANAGLQNNYLSNLLNFGSLAGQLGSQSGLQQLSAVSQFPGMAQTALMPGQTSAAYADYQRQLAQNALNEDVNRFNFNQSAPQNQLNWYSQIINGMAGLGGTQTTNTQQNMGLGDLLSGALGIGMLGGGSNFLKTGIFGG